MKKTTIKKAALRASKIPYSDLKEIAVRLKKEREKIEPLQKDFAIINSISINSISRFENAHQEPSTGYLYKLGEMGASIDYIFYGESRGNPLDKS